MVDDIYQLRADGALDGVTDLQHLILLLQRREDLAVAEHGAAVCAMSTDVVLSECG